MFLITLLETEYEIRPTVITKNKILTKNIKNSFIPTDFTGFSSLMLLAPLKAYVPFGEADPPAVSTFLPLLT
ncbi:hypothetical protein D3C84_908630 [compost metagenome]